MPSKLTNYKPLLAAVMVVSAVMAIMAGIAAAQQTRERSMISSPVDGKIAASLLPSAHVEAVACGKRLGAKAWDKLEQNQKVKLLNLLLEMYLSCEGALNYIVTDDGIADIRQRDHAEVMFDQVVNVKFSGKMSGVSGLTTGFIIDLNAFKNNNPTLVLRRWPGKEWSAQTISTPNPRFYKEFCRVLTGLTGKDSQ